MGEQVPRALSLPTALLLCLLIALVYVSALYVRPPRRKSGPPASRQDDHAIKRRAAAVLCACALTWVPVHYASRETTGLAGTLDVLSLGRQGRRLLPVLAAVAHVCVLYAGPILLYVVAKLTARRRSRAAGESLAWALLDRRTPWQAARDLCIAPVTEEWAFRACMVPLLGMTGVLSHGQTVALTPLFFGAAHFHHLYERITLYGTRPSAAVTQTAVQFCYTYLFGMYATHALLALRSVAAVAAAHAVCNYMGLPDLPGMLRSRFSAALLTATGAGVVGFLALCPQLHRV